MNDRAPLEQLLSIADLQADRALADFRAAQAKCDSVMQDIAELKAQKSRAEHIVDQAVLERWQRWRAERLTELIRQFKDLQEIAERARQNAAAQEGRRNALGQLLRDARDERRRTKARTIEEQPFAEQR